MIAFVAGCGSKDGGGGEVVKKMGELEKAMCACQDEACAVKVRSELKQLEDGGAMKKPTDKQMSAVMDSDRKIRECERKFVLDEPGKLRLDQMKAGLTGAREKVAAGNYTSVGMSCTASDAAEFKNAYGGFAAKPEIAAFLDDYRAYCSVGMHIEAVTKVVEQAEAARAAKPEGTVPGCTSAEMALAEVKLKDVPDGAQKLAPLKERLAKVCGS